MSSISNVTLLDNNNYKLKDSSIAYGTCSTGASTATKVVTVADTSFELRTGSIIGVKFTTANTASSVKLNVNSSGAKSIYYNNAVYTGTAQQITGAANCVHYYMYDGTNWCFINYSGNYTDNNTYTSAYCTTAAGTAAKTASCTNYVLTANTYLHVIIATANSYAGAITLNVNSKGAKPIYINGSASSSSNYTLPAGSYVVFYNGTNYYFRTDGKLTANITGNAATAESATSAGTASKLGSTDVGGTAKPIWLDDGTPKAISDTVGGTDQPVYLNSGTISAMSGALSKTYGGTGNTTGTATYATTTADTSNTLYPIGVTSGATTTLKRDTSVTIKGGTVTATTFSGSLSGEATSAGKFSSSRTITLTGDATGSASGDGSSGWSIATTVSNATTAGNVTGVVAIANGGTGQTTATNAINKLLQDGCSVGSSNPVDGDTYIASYADGKNVNGTGTNTFHRRPISNLWEYMKGKISSVLGLTVSNYGGNAATATSATSATSATKDSDGNTIKDTYVKLAGGTMSGQLKTSFKTSVATGSYQAAATTIPNLCEELRYSSGVMGSANIATAYTNGNITIATGWYNFLWIPHRSGGTNGSANGDNCNYGSLYLSGMTLSGCYMIRYSSSAIAEVRDLYQDTWRGVQNNLTSTATDQSLSAAQGKVLNEKFGSYLPLAGGTMTGDLLFSNPGATATRQIQLKCADNDYGRIAVGGTATNSGYMEIATADDGTEPIYARQYSGVYTTLQRTATILDSSGNTAFPGNVKVHDAVTLTYNASTQALDFVFV